MNRAVAIANNDVAIIAWSYDKKIRGCLGFAVYRTDLNSRLRVPLPAWVGFTGQSNKNWKPQTTEIWPVQKFNWRDLTARRGGFYQYDIVPMGGSPGKKLMPISNNMLTTNPINLTAERGDLSAYFNRGILSTQSISHQIPAGKSGLPNYQKLQDRIDQPGDPLRERLTGDLKTAVRSLLDRAERNGGQCYAALYELSDTELEQLLIGKSYVHLVLSNTGPGDEENLSARQALHESHVDITDRMLGSGHIGHNKFVVYVDAHGIPTAVLTGSTNWTAPGLCGQSNNAVLVQSQALATAYLDYWHRLQADNAQQSSAFRSRNNKAIGMKLDGGNTDVTLWFSPNTQAKSKAKSAKTPKDMQDVFDAMSSAKDAILFLAFQPGTPSIVQHAAACQKANRKLFVRGAVTDPKAAMDFKTLLFHRSAAKPDATVVPATAINDQFSFWQKELLKYSPKAHAIIHDKIVVIDPSTPDCVVITGSHNLGFRASYNNDENLLLIRRNRPLAESYTAHVMDVYDHYRWRYLVQQKGNHAFDGLNRSPNWQDKYFNSAASRDREFWMNF